MSIQQDIMDINTSTDPLENDNLGDISFTIGSYSERTSSNNSLLDNYEQNELVFDLDESLSGGIPKKYIHITRSKSFGEWEIPPWDLKLQVDLQIVVTRSLYHSSK